MLVLKRKILIGYWKYYSSKVKIYKHKYNLVGNTLTI